MTPAREIVAEAAGTAILMAVVVGSTIMGSRLTQDAGLGLLVSSLATGAALFVLITILGPVSRAHLNPGVTLMFRLRGDISTSVALAFVPAQIAGAIAGAALAHVMFDQPALQLSTTVRDLPSL